jgi:hypothetical protein
MQSCGLLKAIMSGAMPPISVAHTQKLHIDLIASAVFAILQGLRHVADGFRVSAC